MKKNKSIIIAAAFSMIIASVVFLIFMVATSYINSSVKIESFNKNSLRFNYLNSWKKIDNETSDGYNKISLYKNGSNTTIQIDAQRIPFSYSKYTLDDLSSSIINSFLKTEQNWKEVFSEAIETDKSYKTSAHLLTNKDQNQSASFIVGLKNQWLFEIILISDSGNFDLDQIDLDLIINSIEVG